jgi:hypothetical protein
MPDPRHWTDPDADERARERAEDDRDEQTHRCERLDRAAERASLAFRVDRAEAA